MKCINMKIVVILFFTTSLVSIHSETVKEVKKDNGLVEETSKDKFDKDCPHLVRTIRDNGLADYIINCKMPSSKSQEEILQRVCFVVRNMFSVLCKMKINETSLDLLERKNTNNICPFDFSHLNPLNLDLEVVKKLVKVHVCEEVCYELYSTKPQCVLLNKFNNYLKNQTPVQESVLGPSSVSPQTAVLTANNFTETVSKQPSQRQNLSEITKPYDAAAKHKTETVASQLQTAATKETPNELSKKEKKAEKLPLAKEEIKPTENTEIPVIEMKETETDNDRQIPSDDNGILEEDDSNDKMDDSLPDKQILSQESDSQKMQPLEDKYSSNLKEKDTYFGEGFSQTEDSHFFFYFIMMSSVVVIGYLAFHNKNKILAYALEGGSGRRSRRRPNPARYRKLETNLEEAISSNPTNTTTSSVVY